MTGILIIDKPGGLTSFGALIRVKKIIKQKKCGHTGTLDPMATGALTVLLGGATRFSELLPDSDKAYTATLRLGTVTDTLDITGKVLGQNEVTAKRADFEKALGQFKGKIMQTPPMFSAVSVDGRRLYELAREGKEVERAAREVEIHSIELTGCDEESNEYTIDVSCSSGTYIRSLADDIGRALGCGATLTALRRTRANGFSVNTALTLETLAEAVENGTLAERLISVDTALGAYPAVKVTDAQAVRFSNGGELMTDRLGGAKEPGLYRVYSPGGTFLGVGENRADGNLYVKRVFRDE
jgi:tRNA pseudouridine55 synthase